MPTPTVVLLFGAVIALAIFAAIWSAKVERQRVATLTEWGKRSGWRLELGEFAGPKLSYGLFDIGHSRSMRDRATNDRANAVPGLDPVSVAMFQYHYAVTTSNGKTTTTHHYHFVCALVQPGLDLGSVLIRPETWSDKIAGAVGFDDIDFEDAQFSKRYYVSASDRRNAYDLIDGPMMRFLCSLPAPRIETNGRELLAYVPGKATAESYTTMASFVRHFLAQIPRPLVNAERARSGRPAMLEAGNAAPSSRKDLEDLESR